MLNVPVEWLQTMHAMSYKYIIATLSSLLTTIVRVWAHNCQKKNK